MTVCGNGVIEPGEQCDGDDLYANTCETVGKGFGAGQLGCTAGRLSTGAGSPRSVAVIAVATMAARSANGQLGEGLWVVMPNSPPKKCR